MKIVAVGIQPSGDEKHYTVWAHQGGRRYVAMRRVKGQVSHAEMVADIEKVKNGEPVAKS